MKKFLILTMLVLAIFALPNNSWADCGGNEKHSGHSLVCPNSGYNLFGGAYNSTTDNWGWYIGAKTAIFHPARWVWVGGVGLGVAFDQSTRDGRGPLPVLTFVPLQLGSLSLEVTVNKISSKDNQGVTRKNRLIILAWNFKF